MAEKEIERIKPFKNDINSVWYKIKHYRVMDGKLVLCAGGEFNQEDYDYVFKYFRNKKLI